jgi:hypothetical protein
MGNQLKNNFIDILLFFILNIGDPIEPKKFLIQKTILLGLWKLYWVEKESDGGGKEERERERDLRGLVRPLATRPNWPDLAISAWPDHQ